MSEIELFMLVNGLILLVAFVVTCIGFYFKLKD